MCVRMWVGNGQPSGSIMDLETTHIHMAWSHTHERDTGADMYEMNGTETIYPFSIAVHITAQHHPTQHNTASKHWATYRLARIISFSILRFCHGNEGARDVAGWPKPCGHCCSGVFFSFISFHSLSFLRCALKSIGKILKRSNTFSAEKRKKVSLQMPRKPPSTAPADTPAQPPSPPVATYPLFNEPNVLYTRMLCALLKYLF